MLGAIRLDDILILILIFILLFFLSRRMVGLPRFFLLFYVYVGWSFVCLFVAVVNNRVDLFQGVFFVIRPLEYFVFFYVGVCFKNIDRNNSILTNVLKVYIIYAGLLILLQSFNVVGVVSGFSSERAIANTGGPWEMALVASFLAIYFYFKNEKVFCYFAIFLLILTESRVTLLATAVAFFVIVFNGRPKLKSVLFLMFFLPIFLYFFYKTSLYLRIESVLTMKTLNIIKHAISFSYPVDQSEYFQSTYGDSLQNLTDVDGDASASVRFTRWAFLLKSVFNSYVTAILGLGPSFAGKAVDGNFVRLIVENGLVGLFFILFFFLNLFLKVREKVLKGYIISLLVSSCLIDALTTYKAMTLFWFYCGYIYNSKVRMDYE